MTKEEYLKDIKNKIQQAFSKYTFIENGHYYLCNGKRVGISTTGLFGQYEQKFDSDTISQRVANKRNISQQEVLEEWRIENLHSTIKGSLIHEFAQSLWEGKEYKFDYHKRRYIVISDFSELEKGKRLIKGRLEI